MTKCMTSHEMWACLKEHGCTKHRVLARGADGIRRVILESRDTGEYPSIAHPDDLTPEERVAELSDFLRHRG